MTSWFVLAQLKKRNDIADTAWGLGFVLVAWVSAIFGYSHAAGLLVNALVSIWGIRLALHIYLRNKHKSEDARYKQLVPEGGRFRWLISYAKVFLLQGFLLWVITLPVQVLNFTGSPSIIPVGYLWLGLLLWGVGFCFEVIGDLQLTQFLADPKHPKVLQTGLWRYTRHPNYFGEVSMWCGIFVIAFGAGVHAWAVVGPLLISYLVLFVSGVPILERRYKDDAAYQKYAAKTSKFFPLPPRK